jgi:hypothetical protein
MLKHGQKSMSLGTHVSNGQSNSPVFK